jgi:hypothetical protein
MAVELPDEGEPRLYHLIQLWSSQMKANPDYLTLSESQVKENPDYLTLSE